MGKSLIGKKTARLLVLSGLIIISLILPGCGTLDTLLKKDGSNTSLGDWIGGKSSSAPAMTASTPAEGKTVSLYFPDSSGKFLIKEERTLPKTLSLARETASQWLIGPAVKGSGVQAAVAPNTSLLDIAIKEGIVTVDLSKEFLQPAPKVSAETALYGLVNTLAQFSTVKEVKIRVEGKPITKYGAVDAAKLTFKESLVKGSVPKSSASASASASNPGSVSDPVGGGKSALPNSPSSINLFSYPPSSI